ncbi:NUDIX hydrolase [Pleomorphovibrio marinus]|uniref:NUDIX hydrolase n=1 Tax=Pleomorphovibrio marinus TaxID=2164132 RepID=UPI000E0C95D8|nr:NUDIX domain-containing protein [Pleomorphovibrio marinus]
MYVSVDCVLFGYDKELSIFLIRRTNPYFKNKWSLPGSIIFEDESLESAAERTIYELLGLSGVKMKQVQAFGDPGRTFNKPRILTVAYLCLLDRSKHNLEVKVKNRTFISQTNEEEIILEGRWFPAIQISNLPQDHSEIARFSLNFLKESFKGGSTGLALLPDKFQIKELQKLYESIFCTNYDPSNFRKKMIKEHQLVEWKNDTIQGRGKKTKFYSLPRIPSKSI